MSHFYNITKDNKEKLVNIASRNLIKMGRSEPRNIEEIANQLSERIIDKLRVEIKHNVANEKLGDKKVKSK